MLLDVPQFPSQSLLECSPASLVWTSEQVLLFFAFFSHLAFLPHLAFHEAGQSPTVSQKSKCLKLFTAHICSNKPPVSFHAYFYKHFHHIIYICISISFENFQDCCLVLFRQNPKSYLVFTAHPWEGKMEHLSVAIAPSDCLGWYRIPLFTYLLPALQRNAWSLPWQMQSLFQ